MNAVEDYRMVWENSYDAILVTRTDGTILCANPAACKMFDMTEIEICELGRFGILDLDDPRVPPLMKERSETGKARGQVRLVRKDGSKFECEVTSVVYPDKSDIANSIITIRDITEQQEKEKQYRLNQEMFSLFMRYSPIYTFIKETTATESRVVQASDNYIEMIGIAGPDMVGKTMEELFPPEFAVKITADDWAVVCKGEVLKVDEDLNGRHYATIKYPINLGEKTLLAGYTIDITDRVQTQLQLQKLTEELQELIHTKDKFFSIIAHDLKNPFQGLIGYSKILSQEYFTLSEEEKLSFIKSIEDLSTNTFSLLNNLLDWSRLQTGKMIYDPEELNLLVEVYPTLSLNKQLSKNKSIDFHYSIDNSIFINADKNMLNTIIRNLISNSIKFTKPGGSISISANRINGFIQISVSDTGVGIMKDNLEKLFKIDSDLSAKGTADETGTGLGLLLCKEMVEKHNGRIWVESEIGKGTTFHFTIPAGR